MPLPGYPTEPFPKVMFGPDKDFAGIAPNGRFLRRNRVAVSGATVGTTSLAPPYCMRERRVGSRRGRTLSSSTSRNGARKRGSAGQAGALTNGPSVAASSPGSNRSVEVPQIRERAARPPAGLAGVGQRQLDRRDSEQRDDGRLFRVALHAVVV